MWISPSDQWSIYQSINLSITGSRRQGQSPQMILIQAILRQLCSSSGNSSRGEPSTDWRVPWRLSACGAAPHAIPMMRGESTEFTWDLWFPVWPPPDLLGKWKDKRGAAHITLPACIWTNNSQEIRSETVEEINHQHTFIFHQALSGFRSIVDHVRVLVQACWFGCSFNE